MTYIPKQLKIACFDYKVEKDSSISEGDNGVYGSQDHSTLTIKIAENLPPQVEASVLMHEILHAVLACTQVALSEELEEAIVNSTTIQLCQVLRDNPSLLTYLEDKLIPIPKHDPQYYD
jgi:hypothetical protein